MKYPIGSIVILSNEKQVYITDCDAKQKKYKGFDAEDNNAQEEIVFSESEVILKV